MTGPSRARAATRSRGSSATRRSPPTRRRPRRVGRPPRGRPVEGVARNAADGTWSRRRRDRQRRRRAPVDARCRVGGETITVVFYDSRMTLATRRTCRRATTATRNELGRRRPHVDRGVDRRRRHLEETLVSTAGSNFGWMTHGSRGSASGATTSTSRRCRAPSTPCGRIRATWSRASILGTGLPTNGFSVFQDNCVYDPNDINAPAYIVADDRRPMPRQGGLDQNIYGARL